LRTRGRRSTPLTGTRRRLWRWGGGGEQLSMLLCTTRGRSVYHFFQSPFLVFLLCIELGMTKFCNPDMCTACNVTCHQQFNLQSSIFWVWCLSAVILGQAWSPDCFRAMWYVLACFRAKKAVLQCIDHFRRKITATFSSPHSSSWIMATKTVP
jgi:hypothetical protein